jgi:hypothetical protein
LESLVDQRVLARGRELMYISIITLPMGATDALEALRLLGLDEGDVGEIVRCISDLLEVSVEHYRVDLDPVTRSLFTKTVEGFYERVGYKVEGNPGSLRAMIAFMAKLVDDEVKALELGDVETARKLRVTQLRFLNTHVRPLLEGVIVSNEELSRVARILLDLVYKDIELLKDLLLEGDIARPPGSHRTSVIEWKT